MKRHCYSLFCLFIRVVYCCVPVFFYFFDDLQTFSHCFSMIWLNVVVFNVGLFIRKYMTHHTHSAHIVCSFFYIFFYRFNDTLFFVEFAINMTYYLQTASIFQSLAIAFRCPKLEEEKKNGRYSKKLVEQSDVINNQSSTLSILTIYYNSLAFQHCNECTYLISTYIFMTKCCFF